MRTATPLVTWWSTIEPGSSAGSTAISTPRFIGPGCMTRACGGRRRARCGVRPYSVVYSLSDGTSASRIRSRCIRNRYSTSRSGRTASRSWLTSTGHWCTAGGRRVGGDTSVTWAPSAVNACTLLRATRLWATSPTIAMRRPSKPVRRCSAVRIVKQSSSAWVGCWCQPSPAFTTEALVHRVICCGAPLDPWRITKASTPIAVIVSMVSRRLSPLLTLLVDTEKFITSALSRRAAVSKLVRVRVESSKNRFTTVLPRSAGTFGIGRWLISTM